MSLSLAIALAVQASAGRQSLGVYERWGAFRDASPPRCFAIAEPLRRLRNARWRGFASIATWPSEGARGQLHIRLGRARNPSARVTLSIGQRRFELVAGSADAWAPDARTDAAIVAAIRSGRSMSVESAAANGAPFADVYPLRGAATAIDAAAVGCAGR